VSLLIKEIKKTIAARFFFGPPIPTPWPLRQHYKNKEEEEEVVEEEDEENRDAPIENGNNISLYF